jgi:hypothetical protein
MSYPGNETLRERIEFIAQKYPAISIDIQPAGKGVKINSMTAPLFWAESRAAGTTIQWNVPTTDENLLKLFYHYLENKPHSREDRRGFVTAQTAEAIDLVLNLYNIASILNKAL